MRITSNSQYLQSVYSSSLQKANATTESTATETLDNESILEKLKEQIKARTSENSSDYGDLIASGQMAKMNFRIQPTEETGDTSSMEAIRTSFDTIRDSDIESLSAEDSRTMLTNLQSSLEGASSPDGSFEAISQLDVSSLSDDQVKEALSSIQTRALDASSETEGANGMRPMGPPPMGPPPGAQGTSSTDTEETTSLSTLEELLAKLSEDDDDDSLSSIEKMLNSWADKIAAMREKTTSSSTTTSSTATSTVSES